jgi:hypothetical protein
VATPRELEAMVRLGLIDSAQETHRKLVAEEIEKLAAAGDAGSKLDIGVALRMFLEVQAGPGDEMRMTSVKDAHGTTTIAHVVRQADAAEQRKNERAGRESRQGSKKGGKARSNPARDREILRAFETAWKKSGSVYGVTRQKIRIKVAAQFGIGGDAVKTAIRRAKKKSG